MDIRNAQHSLGKHPGRLDDDDLQSIPIKFQMQMDADGIRCFEMPNSEDGMGFHLVLITPEQVEILKRYSRRGFSIDDTHCTTQYNLKLACMMVVDDYDRAVPAGFLLANKMDKEECTYFFREVKSLFEDFKSRFFLTNDTMSFWNGYNTVFPGNDAVKLLCSWHCQRAVFDKLTSCCPEKVNERRSVIKGWIRVLFTQSNKAEFYRAKCQLLTVLSKYRLDDEKCKEFDALFRKYYINRQEQWAPYNRTEVIANTTMVSERWHRTLKYTLLNRSANSRVDELVHILISDVPDLVRDHLVQTNAVR
ncbi:hypothetical protein Aduo_001693 [Ancylostoma duodenale]